MFPFPLSNKDSKVGGLLACIRGLQQVNPYPLLVPFGYIHSL